MPKTPPLFGTFTSDSVTVSNRFVFPISDSFSYSLELRSSIIFLVLITNKDFENYFSQCPDSTNNISEDDTGNDKSLYAFLYP